MKQSLQQMDNMFRNINKMINEQCDDGYGQIQKYYEMVEIAEIRLNGLVDTLKQSQNVFYESKRYHEQKQMISEYRSNLQIINEKIERFQINDLEQEQIEMVDQIVERNERLYNNYEYLLFVFGDGQILEQLGRISYSEDHREMSGQMELRNGMDRFIDQYQ